jgi:hypothetical protein
MLLPSVFQVRQLKIAMIISKVNNLYFKANNLDAKTLKHTHRNTFPCIWLLTSFENLKIK